MLRRIFERFVYLPVGEALLLFGVALVDFLLHPLAGDYVFHSILYRAIVILVITPLTLVVGFLIMRRVPGNVVGPLLIVWSGTVAYGSIRENIPPVLFSLFFSFDMVFGWLAFFLLLLHFPDGKIYPRAAAPWVYRLLGFTIPFTPIIFLSTASFPSLSYLANPFSLPGLYRFNEIITIAGILFILPILLLALLSPVLRYRRGSHRERLQIKWLALFGGFSVMYVILGLIIYPLLTGGEVMNPGNNLSAVLFYTTTSLFPPLAIGIAVLRHRLWDIDLIIRRTLVYSILTIILMLIYLSSVLVLQSISTRLIGHQSPAAIVVSTLAIAGLFSPFRRRIQTFIDRRFYRQKYNAEQVLSAFSSTLRHQVDLEHLEGSIVGMVEQTMQPEHASLWLRSMENLIKARPGEEIASVSNSGQPA